MLKNYHFKHTCNDDNDIGRRKQQQLAYHMFTCEFPVSYITMSALAWLLNVCYVFWALHKCLQKIRPADIGDVVLIDVDEGSVKTQHDDLELLPDDVVSLSSKTVICLMYRMP